MLRKIWIVLGAVALLGTASIAGGDGTLAAVVSEPASTADPGRSEVERLRSNKDYGERRLNFELNRGQADPRILFLSRGPGYGVFLTSDETWLSFHAPSTLDQPWPSNASPPADALVRMRLVGSNPSSEVTGLERQKLQTNYFVSQDSSQWQTAIPNYARVHYADVYPGIDVAYYGNQGQLEYDFIVTPGADPARIVVEFLGGQALEIDRAGDLILVTDDRELRMTRPVAHQDVGGKRWPVECAYSTLGENRIGFRLGDYDSDLSLTIDPVLVYSTYLGGSALEFGQAITADPAGNTYVAGLTYSDDFPVVGVQPYELTLTELVDSAFGDITDPANPNIVSTTCSVPQTLGVSGSYDCTFEVDVTGTAGNHQQSTVTATGIDAAGKAIAAEDDELVVIHGQGPAIVVDKTVDGPVFEPGGMAVFEVRVINAGNEVVTVETLIDSIYGDVSSESNPLIQSTSCALPRPVHPIHTIGDLSCSFTADIAGQAGDSETDLVTATATDPAGTIVSDHDDATLTIEEPPLEGPVAVTDLPVIEVAKSGPPTPISEPGGRVSFVVSVMNTRPGVRGFVTKFDSSGEPVYSTFLGARPFDIAVDVAGNAYITGQGRVPAVRATQLCFARDAFVLMLDPSGSGLVFSTCLGGGEEAPPFPLEYEAGTGIAVDTEGKIYVAGFTSNSDFPTKNAFQPLPGQPSPHPGWRVLTDAFVTKLDPQLGELVYSTYLGGSQREGSLEIPDYMCTQDVFFAPRIAVDALGQALVSGTTDSNDFPLRNAARSDPGGGFLTKFGRTGQELTYSTYVSSSTDVALDSQHNAYVLQPSRLVRFDPSGTELPPVDVQGGARALAVDSDGRAHIAGFTSGPYLQPVNAVQPDFGGVDPDCVYAHWCGCGDAYVIRLNKDLSEVGFATYLGGGGNEEPFDIATDAEGNTYVTGWTSSPDFLTTPNAFDETCGPPCDRWFRQDAFVTKIGPDFPVIAVAIDIKPDSYPNSINPHSRGVIPVAILGNDTFDVADIDVTTLTFGPGGAAIAHLKGHVQDVNYDGIMDLVTHYRTRDTGIVCDDESATLTGETLDGQPLEGTDSINTVGCRAPRRPAIWMKDEEREADSTAARVIEIRRE